MKEKLFFEHANTYWACICLASNACLASFLLVFSHVVHWQLYAGNLPSRVSLYCTVFVCMLLAVNVCLAKYTFGCICGVFKSRICLAKKSEGRPYSYESMHSPHILHPVPHLDTLWRLIASFPCWLFLSPIKTCEMCCVPYKRVWRARLEGFLWITSLCIRFKSMAVFQDLWVVIHTDMLSATAVQVVPLSLKWLQSHKGASSTVWLWLARQPP
jgi:hypothetical protein